MKIALILSLLFSAELFAGVFSDDRPLAVMGLKTDVKFQRKFGSNQDIDTGTVPEDVWSVGGTYTFPTSAQTTTVVSSSANDTSTGTGCRTLYVEGLDSNYTEINEVVSLSGSATATLSNQYLRVHASYCTSSGSGEINDGNIDILHGVTILGRVPANIGRTQQLIFTVPANKTWLVDQLKVEMARRTASSAQFLIQVRPYATQTWQTILEAAADSTGSSAADLSPAAGRPLAITEKTDVRVRVNSVGANDTAVYVNSAGFLVDKLGKNIK